MKKRTPRKRKVSRLKPIAMDCALWSDVAMGPVPTPHSGWEVNPWFAIREATGRDAWVGYAVIHRPTGYAAVTGISRRRAAIKIARQLVDLPRDWNFTDIAVCKDWQDARVICKGVAS